MIHIRINDGVAEVEFQENGVSTFKTIGGTALIQAFLKATRKELDKATLTTPILPPGTIAYQEVDDESYEIFMNVPAHREPILYFENTPYENVGVPNCIFRLRVREKMVIWVHVWCLPAKTIITPETHLYHWPFYNADYTGYMCLGTTNRLEVEEPWQLFRWPGYFFSQSMSSHGTPTNNSGLEGRSMMQALSGRDFPDEWLTPMNRTLRSEIHRN